MGACASAQDPLTHSFRADFFEIQQSEILGSAKPLVVPLAAHGIYMPLPTCLIHHKTEELQADHESRVRFAFHLG